MRIGEAVSIRKKDLEFVSAENEQHRIRVYIPAKISKNKIGRSTFISSEALSFIQNKLQNLGDDDLVWGVNQVRKTAVADEQAPFSRYLKKVGLDKKFESTGRRKISLHSLRAYFFTKASRVDPNFAQLITGHSGYLLREYDQLTTEDKLEIYLKVEPELTIDSTEKLKAKNEKLQKDNSVLQKGIIQLASKMRRTDSKVERLLKEMAKIKPEYAEILEIRKSGPY